ncbi:hypothetical protein CEXT_593631 [Caerostris extrusa]|uniref:Uncharacterized protein n=1 Tax=Caerostris extrusa TaxID=172846 RepID=A0AAV4PXE7_CAEEX|nr:hypothetical protein CEXT_593631 [Caerostris extrusa]
MHRRLVPEDMIDRNTPRCSTVCRAYVGLAIKRLQLISPISTYSYGSWRCCFTRGWRETEGAHSSPTPNAD